MDAPQYLSLKDLATYASLSVKTLRGYLTHPLHPLPHYRMPGKILVKPVEFDAWMQHFHQAKLQDVGEAVDKIYREL
jgi:hypothetical protein